jgi:Flp pilus assembly protein TadG
MFGKLTALKKKSFDGMRAAKRAQALVEFSIALPVLLLMLVGIMEAGRMLFMYASVVNSSRDAVRYASAYGRSDVSPNYYLKYKYCAGIADVARKSGFILKNPVITITYDTGPGGTSLGSCPTGTVGEANVNVDTGDRVTVTVSATYAPIMNKLLPFGTRTFTATSSRTILGVLDLDN